MLILPQLGKTLKELAIKIPVFIKEMVAFLQETFENNPEIQDYIKSLDITKWNWNNILTKIANTAYAGVSSVLISTVSVASGIFGVVFDFIIALVFAIYLLFQKNFHF
jgi:predicted PurR-regulated permease PerM